MKNYNLATDPFCILFILAIHKCVFSLSLNGTMSISLGCHSHLDYIASMFHIKSCRLWIFYDKMCIAPSNVIFIYYLFLMSFFFGWNRHLGPFHGGHRNWLSLHSSHDHWFLHFSSIYMIIQWTCFDTRIESSHCTYKFHINIGF
jgi:hypothetical protein